MQKIAIIFVLIACLAMLIFLVYFSFKLLRDTQKQVDAEKAQKKLNQTEAQTESKNTR